MRHAQEHAPRGTPTMSRAYWPMSWWWLLRSRQDRQPLCGLSISPSLGGGNVACPAREWRCPAAVTHFSNDACVHGFPSHLSTLICVVGHPVTHHASLASRSVPMADTVSGSSQVLYCRLLYHQCPIPVSAHPSLSSAGVRSLFERMSHRILLMPAVLSFHSHACVFPRIPAIIALLLCERVSSLILNGLDV